MSENTVSKKKKSEFPHVFVILFIMIVLCVIASYFVSGGEYQRIQFEGRTIIDIHSFKYVDTKPLSLSRLVSLIPDGMRHSADVIFMLMFTVAGLEVILDTKAVEALLFQTITKYKSKESMIIIFIGLVYGIIGATIGWTYEFVAFIPITIAVARSMGLSDLFGVGMILLPGASGWSSGVINVYTTAIAQSIIGLPRFSALPFRIFGFIVFMLITYAFLLTQVKKHRVNTNTDDSTEVDVDESYKVLTTKHKVIVTWLVLGLCFLVYATTILGWGNPGIGGIFLTIGIVGGLLYGYSPNKICDLIIRGSRSIITGCLVVGIARAVLIVVEDTMMLDSLVHWLGDFLQVGGPTPAIVLTTIVVAFSDFLVASANAKVVTMMPVLSPLADILGMQKQTLVLAYCYGDGFPNWFWPSAGVLMASLSAAKIEYVTWIKWTWKMFIAYMVASCALVAFAQIIKLGPF